MIRQKKTITGLVSKICSYWRSHITEEECEFYRRMLKQCSGKALEIGCGGGRLLLRFLYEGFQVEGVDSSPFLLDLLRRKASNAGVIPTLYQSRLDAIEIDTQYHLIYIPLGSFQLIGNKELAELALSKYYRMLEPSGKLVIALFLPWTQDHLDTNGWQIIRDVKLKIKNQRYVERECTVHDPIEQVILAKTRFELWDGKDLLQFDEKQMQLRWYSSGEFKALLKNVGFESIQMMRNYQEGLPYRDAFTLFIAQKN